MSTDITEYLTHEEKRRIAEDVVREKVAAALRDERQVSNLIYDVAEHAVNETLGSELGDDWRRRLVKRATEIIESGDGIKFELFRDNSLSRGEGPARAPMREAVAKNTDVIERRVAERLEELGDDDLGDMLRDALAKALIGRGGVS